MARPRTQPQEVRRRRIIDAARASLIRAEYRELNLDDVARRSGVAKGTLYLYFKDKENLLACVFFDMLRALEERLEQVAPADGTRDSLRRLVEEELDFIDENHYFLAPFAPGGIVLLGPKAGTDFRRQRFEEHLDRLARRLKACQAGGLLRPGDPREMTLFLCGLLRMSMDLKCMRGGRGPLREQTTALLKLFLRGVGTRKVKP